MGNSFIVSKLYEESLDINIKKKSGIYYTPKIIVDYIIKKTIKNHDIVKNPEPKILDISCGCGNFLLEVYDILYDLLEDNIYELKNIYGDNYINYDTIHKHIISKCIYGYDTDINAVNILKDELRKKDSDLYIDKFNIYCEDSLKINFETKFDYIIGNPPYIGHKNLDNEYKKYIIKEYKQVYKGKSDLYFCFFKKIIDNLKEGGICSIITPRYFLESQSAKDLRHYIDKNTDIIEIIDFLGCEVFKNIGVSSCISTLKKEKQSQNANIIRIKNQTIDINKFNSIEKLIEENNFEKLTLDKDKKNKEWILIKDKDKYFYDKIEKYCEYNLEKVCTSFQGIITGCDKAFIIDKNNKNINSIDNKLLKSWVKNKNIQKYIIEESEYKLIYSNDIKDELDYPIEINEFIGKYKEKLLNRRECKKNLRLWYELQWGRKKHLFERKKIMYPYKACNNRFAIDEKNNFSSADVYSFYIKEEYEEIFSYEYLVGLLNSKVYNKYFKINAKKISKNIYDYYPNKVMKIKIFKDKNYTEIEKLSKEILFRLKNGENKIDDLEEKINNLIKISLNI